MYYEYPYLPAGGQLYRSDSFASSSQLQHHLRTLQEERLDRFRMRLAAAAAPIEASEGVEHLVQVQSRYRTVLSFEVNVIINGKVNHFTSTDAWQESGAGPRRRETADDATDSA